MFTGIIQGLGRIESIQTNEAGCRLKVGFQSIGDQTIQIGDSIAVNGMCLTVVTNVNETVEFDVSLESLSKTCAANWKTGDEVNLETALNLSTPLGGHLVTGHVDGIGQLLSREMAGDAVKMEFSVPAPLGRYIAQKGSVCINGVSLTTNEILEDTQKSTTFAVMLVPHTLSVTSLQHLNNHDKVHIEIDVIARYLDRMQAYDASVN
ncbi:MAG: riboflavin synthase [Arenicellales bacterium]